MHYVFNSLSPITILGSCGCFAVASFHSPDKQGSVTRREESLSNLVEAVFGILSEGVKKGAGSEADHTPRSIGLWLRMPVAIHAPYVFMVQNLSRHRGKCVRS